MFARKKKKPASEGAKPKPPRQKSQGQRPKLSLLPLEPRLMFDAAAAATAAEVNQEQVAQEQAEVAVSGDGGTGGETQASADSQDLLQAISTFMPNESRTEVVFVDPTVPNYQDLLSGMDPNIEVIMLDGGQDGIEQMASALSGRTGIDAVHLISHGDAGTLQLGTGTLNVDTMSGEYADELAAIQQALSGHADILVYGCDFAEGDTGQAAVNLLADLTGADVQASTDETGHILLGGDWDFEVQTGVIETSLAVGYDAQMNWAGILGTETVHDTFSAESYSNNNGTQSWSTSWSETDASGGGASGGDVRVNSSQLRIDTDTVGNAISRGVNLSNATSATLTFAYTNALTGADRIEVRVSTDGGTNYQTLSGGIFSSAANTGSGTASFDLSGYMSANTRIQFIAVATGGGERLYVDNVQVSYTTNGAPVISSNGGGATASISVAENTTAVTTVTATDANVGQTLTYSISGGADASKFTIDSSTGALSFVSAPNYESPTDSVANNVYDVTVQVSDGAGGIDTQAIAVTVTNVNEAPMITSDSGGTTASISVAENTTTVTTVTAADIDTGQTMTYSIVGGADAAKFTIDSSTGQLSFLSAPNYETATDSDGNNVYDVTVQVSDGNGGTDTQAIAVTVTNVGTTETLVTSYEPSLASMGDQAYEVKSDQSWGQTFRYDSANPIYSVDRVGLVLYRASDAGAQSVIVSIRSSWNGAVIASGTISSSSLGTSEAWVNVNLSSSAVLADNSTYYIQVEATGTGKIYVGVNDSGTYTDGAMINKDGVVVGSKDLGFRLSNMDSSNTTPSISSDGGGATASVNVAENATTVTTVTAADIDTGQTMTYSIVGGADAAKFTIDSSTGQLSFLSAPNYESATDSGGNNVYDVTVQVSDGNGGTDTQAISVTVTNVNETPTDLALSANTVAENAANGTVVGTVSGTDPDSGDTKTYSFTDSAGGRFAINSSTGQITVADGSLLDYEAATSHTVTVRVTDGGGLTYDETFTINLTNVNETPTDLALSADTVAENAANGTVVGTVTGTDPDTGDTKSYSFTDSAGGRFAINSSTGQITVANSSLLNYEAATSHSVTVRVTDAGGLTYDETFTINVTNVNEAPTGADATVTINEDSSHTLTTANFGFSDVDAGDSLIAVRIDILPGAGTLKLSGVAVTAGQVISVADITAGNLVFTPAANANGTGYANLTFSVRDSSSTYDTTPNTLTVNVTAVNDAPTISNLAGDSQNYAEGAGAVIIEQGFDSWVQDIDSTNFDMGMLTVSIPSGGDSAEDVLSIRHQGTAGGQIGVSGSNVTYQGVTIGTFTGGTGGAPLVVTLNSNATATAVDALVLNITYRNTDTDVPTTGARTVRFTLTDGDGGTSANYDTTVTVSGVNDAPTDLSSGIELNTDGGNDAYLISDTGLSQSLAATTVEIRFAANDLPLETVLMSFNNPAGDELSIQLDDPSNNLEIDFGAGTVAYASAINYRAALVDGAVHTLSVTWDSTAGDWSVYIDGVFIESGTGLSVGSSLDTTNGQFVFGQEQDTQDSGYDSTQYFSGTLYDVRIWNDVRTAGEIAQYYQQQLDVTPAEAATFGLVANWQMDGFNGSNQVVEIVSGNNLSIAHASGAGFAAGAVSSQLSIEENSANGSHVGFVTSEDPDASETFSYSLTDSAGGRFAVNSATGEITVANGTLLDYDTATSHNITVRVTDSGGLTYDETFTINLTNVNETPTDLALSANTVAENAANGTVVGTVSGTDPDSGDTKNYSFTDSAGGRFAINSSTGQITVANSSLLNYESATSHSVTVRVTDAGGLTYDETFTINVTNVNEAPTGANATVTINEDTSHTLTTANFGFSDVDVGDSLSAVRIDSLPNAGSLTLSGVAVTAGQVVTVADITAGNLVFTPAANATGTGYATFTFSVRDSNNTYDTAPHTLTVDVTAANDAPVNTVPGAQTVAVDTPLAISGLSVSDADGNLTTVQLSVTNGTVDVSLSGGATILSGASGTSTLTLTGTQADINATLSSLTYQGNSLFTGTDMLTMLSTDGNGATDSDTVQIAVSNNAPTNVLPAPQTVVEDQPLAITGLSVTDGDGNLATVQLSVVSGTVTVTLSGGATVSGGTNGSNSVTLSGSQADLNATLASLTYQGNGNFSGADTLTITSTDNIGTVDTDNLSITVTPVNETPTDLALSANTVAENAANGTVVGTVTGTDPDSGDTKTYSFTDSAGGRFAINSSTGQITVANSSLLNYEAATSHSVTVRVTDSGGLTYDETFTINLTDVNETPTLISLSNSTVAENAANGTVVGTASTTDPDAGDVHTYSLLDSAGGRFTIDSNTGVITVADGSLLDYDSAASHNLTIRTTDAGGLTYDQAVTINLTNVNETPIDLALSANTVAENAANGTVVGTVTGTDPDSGDTRTYSFTDSAGGRFAINSSTGQITVANSSLLNYEAATSHSVTVRVTDSGGLTYDETFTINVTNVNEAPTGADATVTINEDMSHTITAANFGFSDVDAGDSLSAVRIDTIPSAGSLTLSGVVVTAAQVISVVDITAGNLVFIPASNANGAGYASFTFSVRDSNNAYDSTPNTLTVDVTAANDAPVITPIAPDITFVEDGMAQVIDATGTITDVDSANFDGGVMTVAVTQNGSVDDRVLIGNFGTGLGQVGTSGSNVTYEGVVVGTFTGGSSGSDPLVITFNGSATPAAVQEVYRSIQFNNGSHNPSTATRQITFGLTDGDGGTATPQTKLVYVQAIDDAPTDLSLSGNQVAENAANGTVVGTVTGTDPDTGDTKTYSFTDSAGGRFAINSSTGQITVADGSLLNYEVATGHSVTVRVTDGGGLTYDETFTINLTDINEAPTLIGLTGTTVVENAANGTVVGIASTTDPDAGDVHTYSLIDDAGGRFAIDSNTGVITVADGSLLDYESAASHNLTIRTTDASGLTYDQAVTINLTNVNEAPTGADTTVTISEDTAHTLTTTDFGFSDVDAGDSLSGVRIDSLPSAGSLTLSGVAVTAGQVVSVADLTAGNLVFTPAANANGTGYTSLTFSVRDSNNTYDTTPNMLTIDVTPVNDVPVVIANTGTTVAEGGTDTIDSSELAVTDVEQAAAQLTYSIGTGPAYGRLELTTAPGISASTFTQADIIANRLVYIHNGSETTSDSFTFTVSDGVGGSLGTTSTTLTITPVNDAPTITSGGGGATAAINVAENVSAVTIVTSADVDLAAQALTYSISGGVDQALFTINTMTGALNFTAPPDFEVATDANGDHVYVVQVQVIDSQGAGAIQTIQVTVTDVAEGLPPMPTIPVIPPVLLPTTPPSPTVPGPVPSNPPGSPSQPTETPGPPAAPPDPRPTSSPASPVTATPFPVAPLAERLVPIKSDEPRAPIDMAKDLLSFNWTDEARRPLFTAPPVDEVLTPEPDPDKKSQSVSDLLFSKLDEMTASLEQAMGVSEEQHAVMARLVALTGTTLSAGLIAWALRSGTLLASFMATIPAWRHFDPLPVLGGSRSERERRRKEAERDQQEETAKFSGLRRLLDPESPL